MQGNHSGEVSGGVQVVQNEGSVVAVDGDEGRGFKIIWGIEGLGLGNPLALGSKEKRRVTSMVLALDGIAKVRKMRDSEGGMKMSF